MSAGKIHYTQQALNTRALAYPYAAGFDGQSYLATSATAVVVNELFPFALQMVSHTVEDIQPVISLSHQNSVDMQTAVHGRKVNKVLSTHIGIWCLRLV